VALQLQISHGSAYEIIQNCTNRNGWTSANGVWIAKVLKVTTSWKERSRVMKHGSTIMSQSVNARLWSRPPRKSSKRIEPQESLWLQFFGNQKGCYWNIIKRGVQAVNSARYSEMQFDKLKPAIRSKRRCLLS
jgi:hypothetical protein